MVQIGSKFTGKPQTFYDTNNGVYWASLPKFDSSALALQSALLKAPAGQPRRAFWRLAKRTQRTDQP